MASDQSLREVDSVDGSRRYRRQPDGSFNITNPADIKAALNWGCFKGNMMGGLADGEKCACGFANYFWPCSRCHRTAAESQAARAEAA